MNREFKLKYDVLRDNDPTKAGQVSETLGENQFYAESQTRSVCFVWLDGRKVFLNYSYMLSGEFSSNEGKNQINLVFTSHTVMLQGYVLEQLFMALFDHLPKVIYEVDQRYVLKDISNATVTDILVTKREN